MIIGLVGCRSPSNCINSNETHDIKHEAVKRSFDSAAEIVENKCVKIHLSVAAEWQHF